MIAKKRESKRPNPRAGETFERIEIDSRTALRNWLTKNHTRKTSVWCVTWKKRPGAPHVPYSDIVEEALCFGWIDSLPRALDESCTMLLLSPRKPDSNWSKLNKDRANRMIEAGRMTQAGLSLIDAAKANGRWNFLDDVEALSLPADLLKALAGTPNAKVNWDAFPPSTQRGILEWIKNAKAAETRARRVAETAALAGKNVRANQYRQKLPGQAASRANRNR